MYLINNIDQIYRFFFFLAKIKYIDYNLKNEFLFIIITE